jgi:hypothetical protein
MVTLGGSCTELTTTIFTAALVVESPPSSVATAVSVWFPASNVAVTV